MLYRLYQLFGWLAFITGLPFLFLYIVFTGRYREGLGQRLGFLGPEWKAGDRTVRIWIHGASVGEVLLAGVLIKELVGIMPEAEFVLSAMTEQGMEIARKQAGDRVRCIYAPLDLAGIVGRTVRWVRPDVYVCLETELWPALLLKAAGAGTRLLILNGRLSERSFKRYLLVKGFMRNLLSCFSRIAVIQQSDGQRFLGLGAKPDRIRVLGNAKYDQDRASLAPEREEKYRSWLGLAPDQPLLVAGSTHTGEEEMLLGVVRELKNITGRQDMVLVLAPRHLQRLPELEAMLGQKQVPFELLSDIKQYERKTGTVIVDSMGDLAGMYSVATYVFCGGSFVERGGHNVMEAALFGRPVFYGPSMKDFSDAAELLESVGGGFPVKNPQALTESILYFMDHPEEYESAGRRAREIALQQQGSARKQAELVREVLSN